MESDIKAGSKVVREGQAYTVVSVHGANAILTKDGDPAAYLFPLTELKKAEG